MQRAIKYLALAILVVALVLLALVHYSTSANQQQRRNDAAALQEASNTLHAAGTKIDQQRTTIAGLRSMYNQLQAECLKGSEAYAKVPAAAKAATPAPNCGTPLAE